MIKRSIMRHFTFAHRSIDRCIVNSLRGNAVSERAVFAHARAPILPDRENTRKCCSLLVRRGFAITAKRSVSHSIVARSFCADKRNRIAPIALVLSFARKE
jgi:hypothetical protein